jgi:hypothetical protein
LFVAFLSILIIILLTEALRKSPIVRLETEVHTQALSIIFSFYLWVLHPVAYLSNLVSYDAVNRNKVSIRQLSLVKYLIVYLT